VGFLKKFFKTVAVVTVFSVSEKFLGFLYRIFLSRTIGAEGIGIYQVALSVFALLLTVCSSGTPVTVSRLMTKYKAECRPDKVRKIITAGLSVTVLIAVPVCALMYIFSGKLGFLFADPRCKTVFLIVLPALVFNSVYAVLRGVFWGNKDFLSYSVIELLEEISMIVVGVILIAFSSNVTAGAYGAGIAVLVSYILSFSLATIVFFVRKNKFSNPRSEYKTLITSAAPITVMRTANSLALSLVSVILPLRLMAAGMSGTDAMSSYGAAVGQAIPLLFIPTTLIGSFTLVLIPEISENFYKKQYFYLKRDIEKSLKFTLFVSCLFIPVFIVCGKEIGVIVFGNATSGEYLSASAWLMFFMGISNITTSMLNSMGFENTTLVYFIISGVFMLICVWFLPLVIGIYALLVGFGFVYGLTAVLNLIKLHKVCKEKPRYIKFIICSALLIIPTVIFGLMLEKLLLPSLGIFFTFLITSVSLVIFGASLYAGFNLIDVKKLLIKLKSNIPTKFKKIFGIFSIRKRKKT